jgi:cardiolipin synthase A/B
LKKTLFNEGDALYCSMLNAMNDATTEILLESYIFALDSVGARFIEMLNHKAKQGLKIKLHLDAVGSQFIKMGPSLKKQLDERIQLKWFHRWSWRRPWQFNIRDHRKLLIVDSNQVFLGGFNIHKQSSLIYFGDLRWRDSHIKIEGEIVEHFRRYFITFWHKRGQHYLGPLEKIDLVPNLSFRCRYLLRCKLKSHIDKAQSNIFCTTPYFVPDEFVIKALIEAAKRGVDVRLLVPFESDHALVNALANRYYFRLIESGIKVFAYLPRMIHAKTIIIDSRTAMIGSANLDYRSLFINYELVCFFHSKSLALSMTKAFLNDCQQSMIVTRKTKFKITKWWLLRPLAALLKHWI